jgi:D-alanyl-D-alanine carboxypeptidase
MMPSGSKVRRLFPGILTQPDSTATSTAQRSYQRIVDSAVTAGVPGLQALVRKGDARWSVAAGLASVEHKRALTSSDRMRVASITKLFTYAATYALVDAGRLRLTDRALSLVPSRMLDGIPYGEDITVEQLLEHTSGLHNFNGANGADFFTDLFSDAQRGSRKWTARDLIAYARKPQNKPTNKPGEARNYSSTGYIVLESILERASGKPFPDLYHDLLFEPLGMSRTGVEGFDLDGTNIVDSYARPEGGDLTPPSPFDGRSPVRPDGLVNLSRGLRYYNAWARGAGAVATTVDDLARFMDAVTSGRMTVLRGQSRQFADLRQKARKKFDWNGGSRGIQATILYEPSIHATVIVITNSSNVGISSHDVATRLLDDARQRP